MSELTWLCVSLTLAGFAAGLGLANLILRHSYAMLTECLMARIDRLEQSLKQWERERQGSSSYPEN